MIQMTIETPEGALAALREDPVTLVCQLRIAPAVKSYEMKRIAQGKATEVAGVSRSDFIEALGRFGVSPF
jgi:Uncharacterised protein family (UPF0175)